jgi:peptidoglycan/xylan/chitin deacetylase (PgdA/CDA1 family)
VVVLCYHAISPSWKSALAVRPERLAAQVGWFLKRGYEPITFTEAVTRRDRARAVAVTFDDAYRSVPQLALPVLERLGVPGTMFVPSAFPDEPGPMAWPGIAEWTDTPWEHELTCASWDELRKLRAAGWEIGSHSRTHPHLTTLDGERLAEELALSKAECEAQLDAACTSVAYPYGDVDARVVDEAARAGYVAAASLDAPDGPRRPDPLRWPRICFYRADNRLRGALKSRLFASTSEPWTRLRAWRARGSLRRSGPHATD